MELLLLSRFHYTRIQLGLSLAYVLDRVYSSCLLLLFRLLSTAPVASSCIQLLSPTLVPALVYSRDTDRLLAPAPVLVSVYSSCLQLVSQLLYSAPISCSWTGFCIQLLYTALVATSVLWSCLQLPSQLLSPAFVPGAPISSFRLLCTALVLAPVYMQLLSPVCMQLLSPALVRLLYTAASSCSCIQLDCLLLLHTAPVCSSCLLLLSGLCIQLLMYTAPVTEYIQLLSPVPIPAPVYSSSLLLLPQLDCIQSLSSCLMLLFRLLYSANFSSLLLLSQLLDSTPVSSSYPGSCSCIQQLYTASIYSSSAGSCIQFSCLLLFSRFMYQLLYTSPVWCFCSGSCIQLLSWLMYYTASVSCFWSPTVVLIYTCTAPLSFTCLLLRPRILSPALVSYPVCNSCLWPLFRLLYKAPASCSCILLASVFGPCLCKYVVWLLSTASYQSHPNCISSWIVL